jgi:16S rRNA G966 N2-methylase RsmD
MTILERVNWSSLDDIVEGQLRNRENYAPVISLFRWWARRPHAVVGALLDAAREEFGRDSFSVSDPFSGGGTVAFEAARRQLPVYAQDLYPWPTMGLATTLHQTDANMFAKMGQTLLESLSPFRKPYQRRYGKLMWEITHVIRVRVVVCPDCRENLYLFPTPLVSRMSRRTSEKYGFFGCVLCGGISTRRLDVKLFRCSNCCTKWGTDIRGRHIRLPLFYCPNCQDTVDLTHQLSSKPRWRPVLLQERILGGNKQSALSIRQVQVGDPIVDTVSKDMRISGSRIPIGIETNHLIRNGFQFWSDLYTNQQLCLLSKALQEVQQLSCYEAVKNKLQLCILGAAEMPGYLCRWDKHYTKAYEVVANHRYARSTVVAETNLLSEIGRGTLPRRLHAAQRGLAWVIRHNLPPVTRVLQSSQRRRELGNRVLIVTGSSKRQLLRTKSVELVLTDPPYHDDLQYGELARLFHIWMGIEQDRAWSIEREEAAPNRMRGTDSQSYEIVVTECLAESRRTLKHDGRLVLTYHNSNLKAWDALTNALLRAGYQISGLATVKAENATDHSKRGKQAFLYDLVIECTRRRKHPSAPIICGRQDDEQRRNLLAMGDAMAEKINLRSRTGLATLFAENICRRDASVILIQ